MTFSRTSSHWPLNGARSTLWSLVEEPLAEVMYRTSSRSSPVLKVTGVSVKIGSSVFVPSPALI